MAYRGMDTSENRASAQTSTQPQSNSNSTIIKTSTQPPGKQKFNHQENSNASNRLTQPPERVTKSRGRKKRINFPARKTKKKNKLTHKMVEVTNHLFGRKT